MIKIAIVGSRGFSNPKLFKKELLTFLEENNINDDYIIVSGGAKGADYLAKMFWKAFLGGNKDRYIELKPNWKKYGKKAGFLRNYDIWDNADLGIAFWDGSSKGTEHSFKISKQQNKVLKVIDYVKGESYYVG